MIDRALHECRIAVLEEGGDRHLCGLRFASVRELRLHRYTCHALVGPMTTMQIARIRQLQRLTGDYRVPENATSLDSLTGIDADQLIGELEAVLIEQDREAADAGF